MSDSNSVASEAAEPYLNYTRLQDDVEKSAYENTYSCIAVHERYIAVGTTSGLVMLFTSNNRLFKVFQAHKERVNAISIDKSGDVIATAGEDGFVYTYFLSDNSRISHKYDLAVRAVCLDPTSKDKMFVCGGLRGQLVMNKKSWFSYQDNVIHENEGPISTIAYSFPFVAWCTEFGTKIYNVETETKVSYVEKPQNAPDTGACKPRLYWYDNSRLCIGWGSTLTMVKMSFKTTPAGNKVWYGEVGKPLEMDYWIAGVGCFDHDNLTILGYDQPEEGSTVAEPPCVYVVNYLTGECLSEECLPIKGYEEYACNAYQLEMNATQSATASATLFMLSPHAIIRITPRSAQDHVDWAVQHNDYERALQILGDRANGFSQEHVLDMREHHLDYLFSTSQIERAAALCPLYLGKDENLWERWIARFNGLHKLHLLLPHIPLVEPRLPLPVYTLVLNYFLYNDIVSFLHLIRSWPKPIGDESDLYDPYALLELLEKIQKTKHDGAVKEALAELYATTHQFEKAVMIYLDNNLAGVEDTPFFSWVEGNDLIGVVSNHVLQLFRLNSKQASEMLCNHMSDIKVGMNE